MYPPNKFKNVQLETLFYIHDNTPVGSEIWNESGYEMSARQQSAQFEIKQIEKLKEQLG